jgi:lauroyl/myristoyl acyltransferase
VEGDGQAVPAGRGARLSLEGRLRPVLDPVLDQLQDHEGVFWRRLARLGARRGPAWFVRYSPPVIGCAAALAVPAARRAVRDNLHLLRGPAHPLKDTVDVARTFAAYASCLTEVLATGSKRDLHPEATVAGSEHLDRAVGAGKGAIFATAHTAGWEVVGSLFSEVHRLKVMMVMQAEHDAAALRMQDEARRARGLIVAHVGRDPLSALPLLEHARSGGVVALQVDRYVEGMRTRDVELFGGPGKLPEGPLRLAQLSGTPLLPIFTARTGFRRYLIEVHPPIAVPRGAGDAELDLAAQTLADAMTGFLQAHPTQWFRFTGRSA